MANKFTIGTGCKAFDLITGPTKRMQQSVSGFSKPSRQALRGVDYPFKALSRTMSVIRVPTLPRCVKYFLNGGEYGKTEI